jgi:hypothetical protein
MFLRQGSAGVGDLWGVSGLQSVNSTLSNQYTGPFIMGLYTACYNANAVFNFNNVLESVLTLPTTVLPTDFGRIVSTAGIPGIDACFETSLIKISGVTAAETCIIKTWACVEYQVQSNSLLYEFQTLSPCDPNALRLYREIINNLPVGVPFEQNETFWNRVLNIIQQLTGYTSFIPGPVGAISRGTHLISGALLPYTK